MCERNCGEASTGRCLVRTDDASVRTILRMARRKPAMRLLTAGIDSEFARVLKDTRVQRVDIATAWATEGPGLDALERAVKQRKVRVRTLVGIAGGHTTPDALKRLCKLGKVRLVEGHGLFHVKLYLFHKASTSSAWVGSANFTGPGFEKNEEVLLETTNAAEAVDWFKNRWKEIDADWSRRRLEEYCKTWKPPPHPCLTMWKSRTHIGMTWTMLTTGSSSFRRGNVLCLVSKELPKGRTYRVQSGLPARTTRMSPLRKRRNWCSMNCREGTRAFFAAATKTLDSTGKRRISLRGAKKV